MSEFLSLINPDGLDYFTPDIILAFFAFCLIVDLIGVLFEILVKGARDK